MLFCILVDGILLLLKAHFEIILAALQHQVLSQRYSGYILCLLNLYKNGTALISRVVHVLLL